jgi:hypothetical protein
VKWDEFISIWYLKEDILGNREQKFIYVILYFPPMLRIMIIVCIILFLFGCGTPAWPTTRALDSKRYFPDPKTAAFVDDVQRGNAGRVRTALAAGMDPNAQGIGNSRPIHFVFFAKYPEVLQLLLTAGADPNARLEDNNTPLHFSVRHGNPEFTRALLAAGADPNALGENNIPVIHEAVNQMNPTHISLLAAAGADLNVKWGGGTPVMAALEIGRWEPARLLIDSGANLDIKDDLGQTALDMACRFLDGLPVDEGNRKGIAGVVESLSRRNLTFPCEAKVARFR